jgi:hypothetical protein
VRDERVGNRKTGYARAQKWGEDFQKKNMFDSTYNSLHVINSVYSTHNKDEWDTSVSIIEHKKEIETIPPFDYTGNILSIDIDVTEKLEESVFQKKNDDNDVDVDDNDDVDVDDVGDDNIDVDDVCDCNFSGSPLETESNNYTDDRDKRGSVSKYFTFLHWNINGLRSKICDKDFLSYLFRFDFICIVETFVDDFQSNVFTGYTVFINPAVKFTKQGRHSGGIMCLIRNELIPYVHEIKTSYSNILLFLIDRSLFDLDEDVIFVCSYVPPQGSPYYVHFDIENGISSWKNVLLIAYLNILMLM